MKKLILFAVLVLFAILLLGQEQPEQIPVQPEETPQVQAEAQPAPQPEEPPQAQAPVPGMDLKRVRFPQAFIHAGKEYAAGDYWLVLSARDGGSFFTVQNAQKETLFEELAIVKARGGSRRGSGFRVNKEMMRDSEYFRVKVTTAAEWLLAYFLVKR